MKRRSFISAALAAGSYSLLHTVHAREPKAPALLTTGGRDVKLGVYLGAGCTGAERREAYEQWLGRRVDQMVEFISWDVLAASTTWAVKCWEVSGQKEVVYALPMLPPNRSAKLSEGAAGKFDDLFTKYGDQLVKRGYGKSVIRIGWEFNAPWFAWDASKDPASWITYWRRIVSALRNVKGADFKFDWNPAAAAKGFNAELAYPGDDYVDIIGLDFYNMPIANADNSTDGRWQARMGMQHGLKWHRDFARSRGKPMSLPEWGTGAHKKWGGSPDDPVFIDRIAAWLEENSFVYHNYWEYWSKELDTRLADGRQKGASAAFLRHFGGPGL